KLRLRQLKEWRIRSAGSNVMLCCRMTSAASSSVSHSWRILWGHGVFFLCCWLHVVLVDDENRCEMFLPKQLT
ncbi:hypothetical protein NL326_28035, partial [Klebsiella pneumoniae]|nr:hypothetical protein [Klebsiella pneumoniae]